LISCLVNPFYLSAQQPTTDFSGIDCGILVEDTEARQYVEVDVSGESRAIGGCATIPIRFLVYPTQTTVSDLRIDLEIGSTTDPPVQVLGDTPFTANGTAGNGALRYTLTIEDLPADDGSQIIAYEYLIYVQSTGGTSDGFDGLAGIRTIVTDLIPSGSGTTDGASATCNENILVTNVLQVNPLPGDGNQIFVSNLENTSIFSPAPGSEVIGPRVVIDGNLVIDIDYTFGPESQIALQPLSSITVASGRTLRIMRDSELYACDEQWSSINVEENATLRLEEVQINDAATGVTLRRLSTLDSRYTQFRDCLVGIRTFQPPPLAYSVSIDALIAGNIFTSTGHMRGPSAVDRLPTAGIVFDHAIGPINLAGAPPLSGVGPAVPNVFEKMYNGIIIRDRSTVSITASTFQDIETETISGGPSGNGIYIREQGAYGSRPSQVFIGQADPSEPPTTFDNMVIGINNVGNRLTVAEVEMSAVKVGIRSFDADRLQIENNELEVEDLGIDVAGLWGFGQQISDNRITVDRPGAVTTDVTAGIRLSGGAFRANFYEIFDNRILLDNAETGILLTAVGRSDIYGNHIFGSSTSYDTKGIKAAGGITNHLYNNLLVGPTGGFTESIGILLQDESRPLVNCNGTYDTEVSMQYVGLNEASKFRNNRMTDAATGLLVGTRDVTNVVTAGVMGPQGTNTRHHANIWEGPFADIGARELTESLPIYRQSEFKVDEEDDADFLPINNIPGENWFDNQPFSTASLTGCATFPPATAPSFSNTTPLNYPVDTFTSVDAFADEYLFESVFKGTFGLPNFAEGSLWTARMRYRERMDAPTTPAPDPVLEGKLLGSFTGTGIEEFYAVRQEVRKLLAPLSKGTEQSIRLDQEGQDTWVDTLQRRTIDLLAATDTSVIAQLAAARLADADSVGWHQERLLLQDSVAHEWRVDSSTALLAQISALPDSTLPQWTEKSVDRLLVLASLDAVDSLSQADRNLLGTLAALCPYEAGDAVYWARGLYSRLDPAVAYDDRSNCAVGGSARPRPAKETAAEITLYPNPAQDHLILRLPATADWLLTESRVRIIDALGKVLPVTPAYFSELEMRFLVGELPVGIYFLSIETADGNLHSMPFSVQR
jgi:hypothetical protein